LVLAPIHRLARPPHSCAGAQVSSVALLYEDAAATKDWCVAAHVLG
jgi:hypothetical protein